jgi:hypothetical protein
VTITVDAFSEDIRTGTTSPQTFSHAGAGSGVRGVVIGIIHGTSATDHVSAVSYGGTALTRIVRTTDATTEPGAAELWFLGASVPQGTQTVSYTPGSTTDDIYCGVATLLGDSDLEVIDFDSKTAEPSDTVADPQVTLQYTSKTGTSAMAFGALYGGGASPAATSMLTGCVALTNQTFGDLGSFYAEMNRQTTAQTATTAFTLGSTANAEDMAYVAMVVAETAAGDVTLTGTGGALALTGGAATLTPTANVWLAATGGALALTGGNATLTPTANVTLAGTGGALTLTGGTASLVIDQDVTLAGTGGSLSLAGGTATTTLTLPATGGALALTGGTATLTATANVWLTGTGGSLVLTGGEAVLETGGSVTLTATGGALVLIGGEAALSFTETVTGATEEQPSGGYGWANLAAIERRRRKREEEELADALEVAMAAEGLIEPDPVVAARHVVRDYVKTSPPASRRMQRAVEYAYRAQSDLAWQLAAREIARQEEEDFALLMVIAFAA